MAARAASSAGGGSTLCTGRASRTASRSFSRGTVVWKTTAARRKTAISQSMILVALWRVELDAGMEGEALMSLLWAMKSTLQWE